jgi:precorrin-3B methylase
VGIGTAVGSDNEHIVCTSLEHLLEHDVGMRSTVIVGNSASTVRDTWLLTARGYRL